MAQAKPIAHTGGNGLFIIGAVLYVAFVGLFLWQTAEFVSWLFPNDQIIYRVITVTTFDVMAVLWACIDTFYRFATRESHGLVQWAWGISFIASLVASIFYMVLQSMTRLDFTPGLVWVDSGYGIVISVTVLQILFLTFFIRLEWMTRHPRLNDYEYDLQPTVQMPAVVVTPEPPKSIDAPRKSIDTSPRQRAVKSMPARQIPARAGRKFTPAQPKAEVAVPAAPLAPKEPETEKTLAIKKNTGPYKVNRTAARLPLND